MHLCFAFFSRSLVLYALQQFIFTVIVVNHKIWNKKMQSYYPQMRVNFVHLTIEMTFNSYSITYSCVISQFTCIQITKEANSVWLCNNMSCLHLLILMDAVLKWAHIRLTSLITNTEHTPCSP